MSKIVNAANNDRSTFRTDILFYLACFVFLYLHLFVVPFSAIYYEADHVNLLNDAKRITEGEFIYRDFFEFLFPGSHTLYAALMTAFGPKYWLLNAVILSHGMIAAFLGVKMSRLVISNTPLSYLASAIFLFFGFRWFGVDGEHRMLSPLFVYLAVLLILPERSIRRLVLAGASCALASFFTQPRGLLAVVAIGLFVFIETGVVKRNWILFSKQGAVLCLSFFGILAILLAPYIAIAGAGTFFDDTVVFLQTYALDPEFNSFQTYFATFAKVTNAGMTMTAAAVFYSAVVPLAYLAGLVAITIRGRRKGFDEVSAVLIICLVGLFQTFATSGPNVYRLFQVSLLGLVVLAWVIYRADLVKTAGAKAAVIALVVFGIALGVRLQYAWDMKTLDTPSGTLIFPSPVTAERYEWLLQNAKPDDLVFETYNSHVNFPLGLRNPSRMSILLNSGYSPPEHVAWAIEDLKRAKPRYIIWDGAWTTEMDSLADGEALKPLYRYMSENYRFVKAFTPYENRQREVWERVSDQR